MADRLDIDDTSIFDNLEERQVEFTGEIAGDEFQFAVQYDVLEALSGDAPDGDAIDTFKQFVDPISDAALSALGRDDDQAIIVISENDLG
jgi:hypothetical protein